jgi:hypothetical protein
MKNESLTTAKQVLGLIQLITYLRRIYLKNNGV